MSFVDVISYEGDNGILAYKYPHSDFNTMSQLIVRESQEAILFKDGQMLDAFPPGRYTMHTKNIPLLSKLVNLPFGGESPFKCDVYFINKSIALNYKWGTQTKTRVMDNQYKLLLEIGASGVMGIKVCNPYSLMLKLVGTENELRAETCMEYFRTNVSARVKEYLGQVMRKPEMNFLILETCLSDFSAAVKEQLNQVFEDVGVEIYNFVIGAVNIPEEQYAVITRGQRDIAGIQYENQKKRLNAQGDAEAAVILAQGRAKGREVEGYNWADEQIAEITKIYAENAQLGENPANMIAQAPMALAFGNMMRGNVESVLGASFSEPGINFGGNSNLGGGNADSMNWNAGVGVGLFMGDDISPSGSGSSEVKREGAVQNSQAGDLEVRLDKMKQLFESGRITKEQYDKRVDEILAEI